MELIQRVNDIKRMFGRESFSENTLSQIISKENISEKGVSFLTIQDGKIYFKVPKPSWNYDTLFGEILRIKESESPEREMYESVKKIAKDYGMETSIGNNSLSFLKGYGPNAIGVFEIRPVTISFNEKKSMDAELETDKEKDEILNRIINEVYLKNKAE